MKGLILKDIYCIRFTLVLGLLMALLPNALMVLVGGGLGVEYIGTQLEIIAYLPYGIVNFITVACFSSIVLNTLKDDVITGWAKYQLTLPVESSRIVLSKQLFTLVTMGALILCCYVPNIFAIVTFGFSVEIMLTMPVVFAMLCLISLMPAFPISLRISTKAATIINSTFTILLMIALTICLFILGDNSFNLTALRIILYAGLPMLAAVVTYISFKASKKALMINIEKE